MCLLSSNTIWIAIVSWFWIWNSLGCTVNKLCSLINWAGFHCSWNKWWSKAVTSVLVWFVKIGCKWFHSFACCSSLLRISWNCSSGYVWKILLWLFTFHPFQLHQRFGSSNTEWVAVEIFLWVWYSNRYTILKNSSLITWTSFECIIKWWGHAVTFIFKRLIEVSLKWLLTVCISWDLQ
jgi:hypothetical protein